MLKKNLNLLGRVKISPWRKSAYGSWRVTHDNHVYCLQTIEVDEILEQIQDKPIKIIHVIGSLCGKVIEKHPQINRLIRFGQFYQRKDISIFFQVAVDKDGKDLSGHTIRNINEKDLSEICNELSSSAQRIKSGDDFNYKNVKNTMNMIPNFLVPSLIGIYGFILYSLNIWTPIFGAPRDPFGSMMITNVGSLGVQTAFAPLIGYSRVPLVCTLGKIYKKPVVKDDQIVIRNCIDIGWSLDHRIIDGVRGAKMIQALEEEVINFKF